MLGPSKTNGGGRRFSWQHTIKPMADNTLAAKGGLPAREFHAEADGGGEDGFDGGLCG